MCVTPIPVRTSTRHRRRPRSHTRRCTPSNLLYPSLPVCTDLEVRGGLWNCQSAVKKADSISAYACLQTLHFLALTETWITPDNTATPAALSTAYSFSHTPRPSGRGGGTGLLISPKWSYRVLPLEHLTRSAFELHAVAITVPINLYIAVIYRPPGPFHDFFDEMDALLSCFPEDGTPLVVLGDFNIQPEKLQSSDFTTFFTSFDLTLSPSPPTHRAGNQLDLVFTRSCSTRALSVTPLPVSDHHFVAFSLPLKSPSSVPPTTHTVTTRRNLKTLSPSTLSSAVLSSLPPPEQFSLLSAEEASSTLLSSLSSSLDSLCPFSSRPVRSSPPPPWLSEPLRAHRTELRTAERKWKKSGCADDLSHYLHLLSDFTSTVSAAKSTFYRNKINSSASNPRKLFSMFSSLLNPPSPPPLPHSLLTIFPTTLPRR